MRSMNKQDGASFLFTLIIVGILGYSVYIGLKLFPVYMEYQSVVSSLDALADEMKTKKLTKRQAWSLMTRKFDVNYIDPSTFKPIATDARSKKNEVFIFETKKKSTRVGMVYEKRIPLIANISAVVEFDYVNEVEKPAK